MLRRFQDHPWFPFVLILGLCVLAFGLLAPTLGFYWDDWPLIYIAETQGPEGYPPFFSYNRPLSAWTYIITVPLLGTAPLYWHLLALLLRALTAAAFWLALRALWPARSRALLWAALLFAVYPTFFSQAMAVAFSQHLFTYLALMVSFAAMLWVVRKPQWAGRLTVLALLTQALHLFTMEYFVGLELLRPLALWFVTSQVQKLSEREAVGATLQRYWPYLVMLIAFLIWRVALVEIPADPNGLQLLQSLVVSPVATLVSLFQTVMRNLIYMLLIAWSETLQPALLDFSSPASVAIWALVLVLAYGLARLLRLESPELAESSWARQALWAGGALLLLGLIPIWLIGRDPLEGLFSDRYTLAALPGAALVWAASLEALLADSKVRVAAVSAMLALAVGLQLHIGNEFRNEWVIEQRFFDQLLHRAPGLEPGTAIIMQGTISNRVTGYAASAAVNTFYPQRDLQGEDYWVFQFGRSVQPRVGQAEEGFPLSGGIHTLSFGGNSLDSVLFFNQIWDGGCLWLLTPLDASNEEFEDELRIMAGYASALAIDADASPVFPSTVFDLPLEPYWCQYYQQAALAAQLGQWSTVLEILQQADSAGFDPNLGREYLPFVQAHMALADWSAAAGLTEMAYAKSATTHSLFCTLWNQEAEVNADASGFAAAWDRVRSALDCSEALGDT